MFVLTFLLKGGLNQLQMTLHCLFLRGRVSCGVYSSFRKLSRRHFRPFHREIQTLLEAQ